jgi:hypothetical protein
MCVHAPGLIRRNRIEVAARQALTAIRLAAQVPVLLLGGEMGGR